MKYLFYFYGVNSPYPHTGRFSSDKAAKIAFKATCRRCGVEPRGYIDKYVSSVVDSRLTTDIVRVIEY